METARRLPTANPFLRLIAQGQITSLDALKAQYRLTLKQYHPDLAGAEGPALDFDRLKQDYASALRFLLARLDAAAPPEPPPQPPAAPAPSPDPFPTRGAYLDEFRNLVARGFPVNVQAATKNRAYTASIRQIGRSLEHRFGDADFFARANREARLLQRHNRKTLWYVLQIFWNLGDYRLTRYDYYRRIYRRHLAFIRDGLNDEGYPTLLRLVEDLVDAADEA